MRQRLLRTQNSTRRSCRTGKTSVGFVGQMPATVTGPRGNARRTTKIGRCRVKIYRIPNQLGTKSIDVNGEIIITVSNKSALVYFEN